MSVQDEINEFNAKRNSQTNANVNSAMGNLANALQMLADETADEKLVKIYNTVADMQADEQYIIDNNITTVQLLGYYQKNDGAGHYRKIENTDDGSGIAVGSLWANETFAKDKTDLYFNNSVSLTEKKGLKNNSNKLVYKVNNNNVKVVQKTDRGYLYYTFVSGYGTSVDSVGVNFGLLRLNKVEKSLACFLWKKPIATTGIITEAIAPSEFSSVESGLVLRATTGNLTNSVGLGLYDLAPNSEATFTLKATKNNIANILFLSTLTRSTNLEIYVNNVLVKTINTNKGNSNGSYITDDFYVPSSKFGTFNYTIKLKNVDTTNKFSFVGFNFFELENYNAQDIDSFKTYNSGEYFINSDGASDYALFDKDINKWCGSYHGGETSEQIKITQNQSLFLREDLEKELLLNNFPNSTFSVLKNLNIEQVTNINNKAKMLTIYNFDNVGTLQMKFSLINSTINLKQFYTALTASSTEFDYVRFPKIETINLSSDTFLDSTIGYVEQYKSNGKMSLGIRYSKFKEMYNKKGTFITNNANYSKFYYGVVTEYQSGVIINNLNFEKCLDFYNLLL